MSKAKIFQAAIIAAGIFLAAAHGAAASEKITLDKLLDRMVNLDRLYQPPWPGEKQIQFSSFDRKSRVVNGEKVDWFANADAGNYYGEESVPGGKEYIMADYQGKGMITRIWSANPGLDHFRIYLDGTSQPVVDEPGETLLSGRGAIFKQPFAGKRAMGYVLLFPIPFAQSCKVTLFTSSEKKPSRYYHIDIVNFPAGTEVQTFQSSDLQTFRAKIDSVASALTARSHAPAPGAQETRIDLTLGSGEEKVLAELTGPGVVKQVALQFKGLPREKAREFLNELLLTAEFDGLPSPAVRAPVGAFFGSTPGPNNYNSLPSEMQWDKKNQTVHLKSDWPMPFQESAKFKLTNPLKIPVSIIGLVAVDKKAPGPDALYFHAQYSFLNNHPTRPFADWTLVDLSNGPGRYVGTMLSVRNPDFNWWGEGDEKVYVDNEQFPSTFGTGTEDYFSYAWGARYFKFAHAYYGMSLPTKKLPLLLLAGTQSGPYRVIFVDGRHEEMCAQYRWQILDQIAFHQALKFDLELWHWDPDITFDVQAMSYWYGAASIRYQPQNLDPGKTPNW